MATAPLDVINIREINPSDIYDIYKIESSTYDYPWSLSILRDCIEKGYDCRLCCFLVENFASMSLQSFSR